MTERVPPIKREGKKKRKRKPPGGLGWRSAGKKAAFVALWLVISITVAQSIFGKLGEQSIIRGHEGAFKILNSISDVDLISWNGRIESDTITIYFNANTLSNAVDDMNTLACALYNNPGAAFDLEFIAIQRGKIPKYPNDRSNRVKLWISRKAYPYGTCADLTWAQWKKRSNSYVDFEPHQSN